MRRCRVDVAELCNDDFLRLVFMPQDPLSSPVMISAHVRLIAHNPTSLDGCSAYDTMSRASFFHCPELVISHNLILGSHRLAAGGTATAAL